MLKVVLVQFLPFMVSSPHSVLAIPTQLKKLLGKFSCLKFLCTLICSGAVEESCVCCLTLASLCFSNT